MSTRGDFVLRELWQRLEIFWVVTIREVLLASNVVSSVHGCCSASFRAQDGPPRQRIIQPKVSVVRLFRNSAPESTLDLVITSNCNTPISSILHILLSNHFLLLLFLLSFCTSTRHSFHPTETFSPLLLPSFSLSRLLRCPASFPYLASMVNHHRFPAHALDPTAHLWCRVQLNPTLLPLPDLHIQPNIVKK